MKQLMTLFILINLGIFSSQAKSINKTSNGFTPLQLASWQGDFKRAKKLIRNEDILVNKASLMGYTPLMRAAIKGHVEIVKLLIAHPKILLNKTNGRGKTALDLAQERNKLEVAEVLIEAGAS